MISFIVIKIANKSLVINNENEGKRRWNLYREGYLG